MTSTTNATRTTPLKTIRHTSRARGLTLTAAAAATIAVAGWGLVPPAAQADPGDTLVPIGSSQLVQSEDLASIQVPLDTERTVLNRDNDFSSCIGEGKTWTGVLHGSAKPITGVWTRQRHDDQSLSESIAAAATPRQAEGYTRTLLDAGVRACQGKPQVRDFHYGPTQFARVGSGYAFWALSYRGSQRHPDGGVVVFRKGTNVGFIEVHGTWGPGDQTMESVAKVAVHRLS